MTKYQHGMVYKGKAWNQKEPYEYWTNIEKNIPIAKHPASIEFMDTVLKKMADDGVDAAINKRYLKTTYNNVAEKYNIKR